MTGNAYTVSDGTNTSVSMTLPDLFGANSLVFATDMTQPIFDANGNPAVVSGNVDFQWTNLFTGQAAQAVIALDFDQASIATLQDSNGNTVGFLFTAATPVEFCAVVGGSASQFVEGGAATFHVGGTSIPAGPYLWTIVALDGSAGGYDGTSAFFEAFDKQ